MAACFHQKDQRKECENLNSQNHEPEMVTEKTENVEHWKRWLGEGYSAVIQDIRKRVTEKWMVAKNQRSLPYFTPHGQEHCQKVEDLIHKLIPGELYKRLEEEERFYLLAAAWLHDIGMMRTVYKAVQGKRANDANIRDLHHLSAEKYITEHYWDCGLNHQMHGQDYSADKDAISEIVKYHRRQEDINRCPSTMPIRYKDFRIQLLAAYLRLADALHIDASRTPDYKYAICLAYNIPQESKQHWIKSRLILGITADSQSHSINITFKIPSENQLKERNIKDSQFIRDKIDYIVKTVVDDLREELASVMPILVKGKIAYYLDIHVNKVEKYIDEQLLTDLLSMVGNYDILNNPSASRLMEMTLMALANITGHYLVENEGAKLVAEISDAEVKIGVDEFLKQLDENLLLRRPCHLGLKDLHAKCQSWSANYLPQDVKGFIQEITRTYHEHYETRERIRQNGQNFFAQNSLKPSVNIASSLIAALPEPRQTINILLFGYSNLVIRALCGLRDQIILKEHYNKDAADFYRPEDKAYLHYSKDFETELSKKINIFICDGQPKTQIQQGNLMFHDGFSYASELVKKNFEHIIMVPDILVGNLLAHRIDYILIGANGFDQNCFKHSAGHYTIMQMAKLHAIEHQSETKIVLVVSDNKFIETQEPQRPKCLPDPKRSYSESKSTAYAEGFGLWDFESDGDSINVRDNIWFLRNEEIERLKDEVKLYNPREDDIPIAFVDYIISDSGWYAKEPFHLFSAPAPSFLEEEKTVLESFVNQAPGLDFKKTYSAILHRYIR